MKKAKLSTTDHRVFKIFVILTQKISKNGDSVGIRKLLEHVLLLCTMSTLVINLAPPEVMLTVKTELNNFRVIDLTSEVT